jgi:hypothetical protein
MVQASELPTFVMVTNRGADLRLFVPTRQEAKGSFPFKVPSGWAFWVSLRTRVVAAAVAVHLIFVSKPTKAQNGV